MATRLAPARPTRAFQPEPAPAERRHLRVIPADYVSARARRKRARGLVVLTGIAIAGALFGVVAFHVVLTQNQLDLQHLRSEADTASVRQQQLRLQVAQLESPERVVDDAQKLGMVPPATVRYLSPDGTPAAPPQVQPPKPKPAATPKTSTAPAKAPVTTSPTKTAAPAKTAVTTKPATTTPTPRPTPTPLRATATTVPARPTR
jgi:cell division protein FtsL